MNTTFIVFWEIFCGMRKNEGVYEHYFYSIEFICRYMSLNIFGLFILQTELCQISTELLYLVSFIMCFCFVICFQGYNILYMRCLLIVWIALINVFILICFMLVHEPKKWVPLFIVLRSLKSQFKHQLELGF